MKKILVVTLLIASVLLSCDKMPMNGDLDGMWQLMSEQVGDSTISRKSDGVYLSFMLHTVQFDTVGGRACYYSEFTHQGDTIALSNICHNSQTYATTDTNEPVTEEELSILRPWGVYTLSPCYHVDRLTKETLVMTSEWSTLRFRKF